MSVEYVLACRAGAGIREWRGDSVGVWLLSGVGAGKRVVGVVWGGGGPLRTVRWELVGLGAPCALFSLLCRGNASDAELAF